MRRKPQERYPDGPPDAPEQLAQWVEKAMNGNRVAFEKLAGLFQEDIFRMVYYRTRSRMDAEDLTQEIFIQAFRKLPGLKKTDRFKSWLFRIAANKVHDFNRKKRFQWIFGPLCEKETQSQAAGDTTGQPDALENLMTIHFWKQVDLLLEKLSNMEKEVFILRFMDQLSLKEISDVMNKGESTVKTHLYRALRKFRREPSMMQFLEEEKT
ncbi:MAG: hypothetical protein DRH37_04910 [Deltaproteobacteria bacterium]|nr:MAG: hypothetical protein DRH37_04910 [Deltaproteobacteria bacterium]